MPPSPPPLRVVVAGTGVAALETVLALRVLAGRRVEITLVGAARDFLLRPATVAEPFVLPAERVWPLPLYELALMTGAHLSAHGVRDRLLTIVTPEAGPLGLFGPAAAEALRPLLAERGIELRTRARAAHVEPDGVRLQ